jgi:hypothetical protein
MEKEILDLFKSVLTKVGFDEARFTIEYTESGDASSAGYIIVNGNKTSTPPPKEVRRKIKVYFDEVKETPTNRFNKATLSIRQGEEASIQYAWEDETFKKDKLESAEVFPQWVNERITSLIYETEFPNGPTEKDEDGEPLYVSTWDGGVFTFNISKGKIDSDILVYKEENERHIEISLPGYFIKAMREHHEITNSGLLKDDWKPWNKLVIHSPHNDLPSSKMNDHVFYSLE